MLHKFSKLVHESAHGTPPQTLQSKSNAHLIIAIIFSAPHNESIHATVPNHCFSCICA